jgi:hypothetical protein
MYGIDKDGSQIGVDTIVAKPEAIRQQGQQKLDAAVRAIDEAVTAAMAIADEYALEFRYIPEQIGTYFGKGNDADGKYDEGESSEGEWYPSTWNSSSAFC